MLWCRALEAVRAAEEESAAKDAEVELLSSQLAAATANQQRLAEVESTPLPPNPPDLSICPGYSI